MVTTNHKNSNPLMAGLFSLCVLLIFAGGNNAHATVPGVRLVIRVIEMLNADPPMQGVIDTLTADLWLDIKTTLLVGPVTLYLTVSAADSDAIRITYSLHPHGPVTGMRSDDVTVAYGAPLIIEDINGKGKSSYRILITPEPVQLEEETGPAPSDTSAWRRTSATY